MARGAKTMLFNPNTTAVVFDDDGRIVAGGERVQVDKVGKVAQEAIDNDLLVLEGPEGAVDSEGPAPKESGASPAKKLT